MVVAGGLKSKCRTNYSFEEVQKADLTKWSLAELLSAKFSLCCADTYYNEYQPENYNNWPEDVKQKLYDELATRPHARTKAEAKRDRQLLQRLKQNR